MQGKALIRFKIVQKNPDSSQYSEIEVKHGEKVKRPNKKNLH